MSLPIGKAIFATGSNSGFPDALSQGRISLVRRKGRAKKGKGGSLSVQNTTQRLPSILRKISGHGVSGFMTTGGGAPSGYNIQHSASAPSQPEITDTSSAYSSWSTSSVAAPTSIDYFASVDNSSTGSSLYYDSEMNDFTGRPPSTQPPMPSLYSWRTSMSAPI